VRKSGRLDSDWFGFEEEDGIFAATSHLLKLGHRNILLVCSGDQFSTGRERQRGYCEAFARHGLSIDPTLIRAGEPTIAHGHATVADVPTQVTAIIAAGTLLTEGVVEALTKQGRAVPSDLSIVGFGTEKWHDWWQGGLTRVIPPVELLAETSAQHLLSRIKDSGRKNEAGFMRVLHATELVIGKTTRPVPGRGGRGL